MTPIAEPFNRFDRSIARRATRNTTEGSRSALQEGYQLSQNEKLFHELFSAHLVLKPAVPYVNTTSFGLG